MSRKALLRRQEVRSPMAGRVVERKVDLGTAVGRDNLETELFVIVDLDAGLGRARGQPADLPRIKEGQTVTITARGIKEKADGKIVFISPLCRQGDALGARRGRDRQWRRTSGGPDRSSRPRSQSSEQPVPLAVPTNAIQTIGGEKIVFVRTADGFEKRPVVAGRSDDRSAEIVTGLAAGRDHRRDQHVSAQGRVLEGVEHED